MERRSWMKGALYGLGGLFAAVIGAPAAAFLTDARKRKAAASDFKEVASLDELPVGEPQQAVIRDRRRDAWTLHANEVVGRVWLVRKEDDTVRAFTSICPHLGCSINFQEKFDRFICPCHNGTFMLDGGRVPESELGRPNPPPRGMDSLETRVEEGAVLVKYENFIQGLHEQVRKT